MGLNSLLLSPTVGVIDGEIAVKIETSRGVDRPWQHLGEESGLHVWKVSNYNIAYWPPNSGGIFFSDHVYIIVKTMKMDGYPASSVFMWIGSTASAEDVKAAGFFVSELDEVLGSPCQHREVMGKESDAFNTLFATRILWRNDEKTAFGYVKPSKYAPRLLVVKVDQCAVATEVDMSVQSMNSKDSFILDAGTKLYVWHGRCQTSRAKIQIQNVASLINNARANGCAEVFEQGLDAAKPFFKLLKGNEAQVDETKENPKAEVPDDQIRHGPTRLLEASELAGKGFFEEIALEKEVKRAMMDSSKMYIIDNGRVVFVWIGVQVTTENKKQALNIGIQYISDQTRPAETPIARIPEGQETKELLDTFSDIELDAKFPKQGLRPEESAAFRKYHVSNYSITQDFNPSKVHKQKENATYSMFEAKKPDLPQKDSAVSLPEPPAQAQRQESPAQAAHEEPEEHESLPESDLAAIAKHFSIYFHEQISKEKADEMLQKKPKGSFLLRKFMNRENEIVLCVQKGNLVSHHLCRQSDPLEEIVVDGRSSGVTDFNSLVDLLRVRRNWWETALTEGAVNQQLKAALDAAPNLDHQAAASAEDSATKGPAAEASTPAAVEQQPSVDSSTSPQEEQPAAEPVQAQNPPPTMPAQSQQQVIEPAADEQEPTKAAGTAAPQAAPQQPRSTPASASPKQSEPNAEKKTEDVLDHCFHGLISAAVAEGRINECGKEDGVYLFRNYKTTEAYVLTVVYQGKLSHHRLTLPGEAGPTMTINKQKTPANSLSEMVSFLSKKHPFWPVPLTRAVPIPSDTKPQPSQTPKMEKPKPAPLPVEPEAVAPPQPSQTPKMEKPKPAPLPVEPKTAAPYDLADLNSPLLSSKYYLGKITNKATTAALKSEPECTFFIRHQGEQNRLLLSLMFQSKVSHHPISNEGNKLLINKKPTNTTNLDDLVQSLRSKKPWWPLELGKHLTRADIDQAN